MDPYIAIPQHEPPLDPYVFADGDGYAVGAARDPVGKWGAAKFDASREQMLPGGMIDPETGIAPRRLTDCVCLAIFPLYVVGMILLVSFSNGDPRRLTHGFDYAARLCGVDPRVDNKPFVFYCRSVVAGENPFHEPSGLNLDNPRCVERCPTALDRKEGQTLPCLQPALNKVSTIDGGQFGNDRTWWLSSVQTTVNTTVYDTFPFAGRYCMPTTRNLRHMMQSPFTGPLDIGTRLKGTFGSFQDPWLALFLAVVVAVFLGYAFLFFLSHCARCLVFVFLWAAFFLVFVGGMFFFWAIWTFIPILETGMDLYEAGNPLYVRFPVTSAAAMSIALGVVLLCGAIGLIGTICKVTAIFDRVTDLVECAFSVLVAMPSLLVLPALLAVCKYLLLWGLCYNFMFLVSVGNVDEFRVVVNGVGYNGPSATWNFNWWELFGIAYYVFGAAWIMELPHAFGQFIVSFAVVTWYYMPKYEGGKVAAPAAAPLHALSHSIVYHLGSLLLGAALIPYCRVFRLVDNLLGEEDDDADSNCCCRLAGKCCVYFRGCAFKCLFGLFCPALGESLCGDRGLCWRFQKDAYTDVVIRSNYFLEASEKIPGIYGTHTLCEKYRGSLQVVTLTGFATIGILSSVVTYSVVANIPMFYDPTSSSYIYDPFMVSILAFVLCGLVAYGFLLLVDHTADTMLYCYAWNVRFDKDSVDNYVPEELRGVVGFEDLEPDIYAYYGRADPNMYLGSFLSFAGNKFAAGGEPAKKETEMAGGPFTAFGPSFRLNNGSKGPSFRSNKGPSFRSNKGPSFRSNNGAKGPSFRSNRGSPKPSFRLNQAKDSGPGDTAESQPLLR